MSKSPLLVVGPEGPVVFDVPVPVGSVIPAGTWFVGVDGDYWEAECAPDETFILEGPYRFFTARPPVAPESFKDGDVAWVKLTRGGGFSDDRHGWTDPDNERWLVGDSILLNRWLADGTAYVIPSPRPESLADVLDDLGLEVEDRERIMKAAQA